MNAHTHTHTQHSRATRSRDSVNNSFSDADRLRRQRTKKNNKRRRNKSRRTINESGAVGTRSHRKKNNRRRSSVAGRRRNYVTCIHLQRVKMRAPDGRVVGLFLTTAPFILVVHISLCRLLLPPPDNRQAGSLRGPAVEHWSLADVLSLSCARLVADGVMGDHLCG